MSQTVVDIPGLPEGVEVRRSTRRRRSVTAYREDGRTVVVVPQRMSRADIVPFVEELVGRLEARERRARRTDGQLEVRAALLSRRHLDGRAVPSSVRWVSNQRRRWGSCTPADGTIRLSDRLAAMPEYVVDYVLLHELVHLLVPHHGPAFEEWMRGYPRLLEARAFLAGVDHATGHGLGADPDPEPDGTEAVGTEAVGTEAEPEAVGTEVEPEVVGTEVEPEVVGTEVEPEVVGTEVEPEVVGTEAEPEAVGTDEAARTPGRRSVPRAAVRGGGPGSIGPVGPGGTVGQGGSARRPRPDPGAGTDPLF